MAWRVFLKKMGLGGMRYVVAVSGGIDSVVLIDLLAQDKNLELVIAHFDHGIRDDSAADARFVAELARKYNLKFETKREELGAEASEETARTQRYAFLYAVAQKYNATLVTAHHADDIVETIAINLSRGTGWRGVAALNNAKILRPLLAYTKAEIKDYALRKRLEWVEDSTNGTDVYLRNRMRFLLGVNMTQSQKNALVKLWQSQKQLAKQIDDETRQYVGGKSYSRYFFINIDRAAASEILRAIFISQCNNPLTRPQRDRALNAICTASAGKVADLGGGIKLIFTKSNFVVESIVPVL